MTTILVKDGNTEISYDTNGNILRKGDNTYMYDGDQLVNYNGQRFEYDPIGNPTIYRNKRMTWSHIGNLDSINDREVRFEYDQEGMRTHKHSQNGTRSEFFYADGKLLAEKRSIVCLVEELGDYITRKDVFITYLYGVDDITGFVLNDVPYYYHKNIQGDVLAIENFESSAIFNKTIFDNLEVINSEELKIEEGLQKFNALVDQLQREDVKVLKAVERYCVEEEREEDYD